MVKFKEKKSLSEIYSTGIEYSFLNKNNEAIHHPVLCKDFLTDVIWSHKTNNNVSLYRFEYSKDDNNLNLNRRLRIAIRNSSNCNKDLNNYNGILNLLKPFEESLNIKRKTIVKLTKDKTSDKECLLITFDKKWISKPYLLSLYLLLVRIGLNYKGENITEFLSNCIGFSNEDKVYSLSIINKVTKILNKETLPKQKYEDYKYANEIHNKSGIVSYKF